MAASESGPEEIVRACYPDAVCRKVGRWFGYKVFAAPTGQIGGKTAVGCQRDLPGEAWQNAAERIARGRRS